MIKSVRADTVGSPPFPCPPIEYWGMQEDIDARLDSLPDLNLDDTSGMSMESKKRHKEDSGVAVVLTALESSKLENWPVRFERWNKTKYSESLSEKRSSII